MSQPQRRQPLWQDAVLKASLNVPGSISEHRAHTLEVLAGSQVAGSQVVAGWDCRHRTAHCDYASAD